MKIRVLLLSFILAVIFSFIPRISIAQEIPNLRQNMPYSKARDILINSGWQAVFNLEQINNPNRSAPVNYFINKGYTEIGDCAGSGLGLCFFEFRNAYGKTLSVTTANNGENKETVKGTAN
ncbi:MAG: hypothetical protein HC815_38490 [Richelia sp. RM1_1_1]|nr:hypothetical protein [Richelia sp. RM1_1_1]